MSSSSSARRLVSLYAGGPKSQVTRLSVTVMSDAEDRTTAAVRWHQGTLKQLAVTGGREVLSLWWDRSCVDLPQAVAALREVVEACEAKIEQAAAHTGASGDD